MEHRVGSFILEGQRQEIWIRSEPDGSGQWHNAAVFRRDGKLSMKDAHSTGLEWHLPPDDARAQAEALPEEEWIELYQRAIRPRPPIIG